VLCTRREISGGCPMGFVSWSMRPRTDEEAAREMHETFSAVQRELSCIVCFDNDESNDWHPCRTCSAVVCDACMARMYEAARDSEEGAELQCPQCRRSIASMQRERRTRRITEAIAGCTEERARALVAYESLLSEVVHLCECREDGMPYFMVPPVAVARVMSRDAICEVVDEHQGRTPGARLRRMLRAGEFGGAASLALAGYASALRAALSAAPVSSGRPGSPGPHGREEIFLSHVSQQLCGLLMELTELEQQGGMGGMRSADGTDGADAASAEARARLEGLNAECDALRQRALRLMVDEQYPAGEAETKRPNAGGGDCARRRAARPTRVSIRKEARR
jgi:hypothetical protein